MAKSRPRSSETDNGTGGPELLRRVNARRILRLLRLQAPCSRADLVRYSGLSAPTVSNTIAYLQKKRLVEPMGPGPSNGGRPPGLLRFNSTLGFVVGVDIGTSLVRVAIADLNGTIVGKWVGNTRLHSTPDRAASLVGTALRGQLRDLRISPKKLLTLVAGIPGITNVRDGVVLSAPILPSGWSDVPLRGMLKEKTGIPTTIENDVNLAALGEKWCGTARGERNFVFLTIGTGVGAGIFVDGRLYHGADWTAGEIGYLYVPGTREAPLAIRRQGSLEDILGSRGIERAWRRFWGKGSKPPRHLSRDLSAVEIFDLGEKGDPLARSVLQQTARILADAITNVCVVLNSSLVILGGRVGSHPSLLEATRAILNRNEFSRPRLALSSLGREAQLLGAIWLALHTAEDMILPSAAGPSKVSLSETFGFDPPSLSLPLTE
jgi:predicted NBD/HSP70 family sugar kinase